MNSMASLYRSDRTLQLFLQKFISSVFHGKIDIKRKGILCTMDINAMMRSIEKCSSGIKQKILLNYYNEVVDEIHEKLQEKDDDIIFYLHNHNKYPEGLYIYTPGISMPVIFENEMSLEKKFAKLEQSKDVLFQEAQKWQRIIQENRKKIHGIIHEIEQELRYKNLLYFPDRISIYTETVNKFNKNPITKTNTFYIGDFQVSVDTSSRNNPPENTKDTIVGIIKNEYLQSLRPRMKEIMQETKEYFTSQTEIVFSEDISEPMVYRTKENEVVIHSDMATSPTMYRAVMDQVNKIDLKIKAKKISSALKMIHIDLDFMIVERNEPLYDMEKGEVSAHFDVEDVQLKKQFSKELREKLRQIKYYSQIDNINHHNPKNVIIADIAHFRFLKQIENENEIYRLYESKLEKTKKSYLVLYRNGIKLKGRQRKRTLKEIGYGRTS